MDEKRTVQLGKVLQVLYVLHGACIKVHLEISDVLDFQSLLKGPKERPVWEIVAAASLARSGSETWAKLVA